VVRIQALVGAHSEPIGARRGVKESRPRTATRLGGVTSQKLVIFLATPNPSYYHKTVSTSFGISETFLEHFQVVLFIQT
jgi:hypothetical protein